MIQALKQLWPKHSEQFTGFEKFPTRAADVPPQWRSAWRDWDPQELEAGKIGDEIDKPENLARFPDEGTLGFWLQCNVGQRLRNPPSDMPFVGLHFVLHAKWARRCARSSRARPTAAAAATPRRARTRCSRWAAT